MLFSSVSFLFLFLPVLFAGWWLVGRLCPRYLPRVLLCASLFFAALWYEDLSVICAMVVFFLANYAIGAFLCARFTLPPRIQRVHALILGLGFNALPLAFILVQSLVLPVYGMPLYVLPAGLPFFVLVHMAFVVTAYRQSDIAVKNILPVALFSSFFPTFLAGPLLRYEHMSAQLLTLYPLHAATGSRGLTRLVLGFAKYVFLVEALAPLTVFSTAHALHLWTTALAFTLHVYMLFSAYTDMALGLALMLGISLPENFDSPYKAPNIIEFWRRWHISLSAWMRDFLYMPLRGKCPPAISVVLVMVLCGVWSGMAYETFLRRAITWNALLAFAAWGLMHGCMLAGNHLFRTWLQKKYGLERMERVRQHICVRFLSTAFTFLCILLSWVLFAVKDVALTGHIYLRMTDVFLPSWWQTAASFALPTSHMVTLVAACVLVWLCPTSHDFLGKTAARFHWSPSPLWALCMACLAFFALLFFL